MKRRAFTILEVTLALALLLIAAVMVGQLAVWTLAERARTDHRLAVIEWSANVLEEARARPWRDLNAEWAARQKLPEQLAECLLDPVAKVEVESPPDRPQIKRVIVEVRWKNGEGQPARPVSLIALFATREAQEGQ